MAQELRQSTSIIIKVGVAVNSTGVTPVTNLTIDAADEAELLKNGTTGTLAIGGTLSAITNCDGWYNLTLSATDTDTLGPLTLAINDDSAILPIWQDYMVVSQNYYDNKYGTTPLRATLTAATYTSVDDFKASGFSTFDPATQGVTLASAVYTGINDFKADVSGVLKATLSSATYTSIDDFKAVGFSTFDPATQGVTLASAVYTSINDFKADVSGVLKATLSSATYTSIDDFKATGFSTFDPTTQGVTLASAVYTSISDFHDNSIKKGTALSDFEFVMILTSDHVTGGTGLTVSGQIAKDGGAFAALTNAVTEKSNGVYNVDLTAAEMNADIITLRFSAATADDTIITIKTNA